jgi:hypothetical protein
VCLLCLHWSIVTTQHPPANDRSDVAAVTPGDALRALILEAAEAGRPTWPVFHGLAVPRLELVPVEVPYGDGRAFVPPAEALGRDARRLVIHEAALVAIETMHPAAVERANRNAKARPQLRQLAAAALRDVCGYPLDDRDADKPSICGSFDDFGDWRAAQRAVAAGRRLWPTLAAWPWWGAVTNEGGPLEWWTDSRVLERFAVWRSG